MHAGNCSFSHIQAASLVWHERISLKSCLKWIELGVTHFSLLSNCRSEKRHRDAIINATNVNQNRQSYYIMEPLDGKNWYSKNGRNIVYTL